VNVLFVCVANENRSQIAEAAFNRLARKSYATSAGLKPSLTGILLRNERGRFVALMAEAGYDISKAKVKRLNKRMADSAGRIVFVFEKKHLDDVPAYLLARSDTELWEVESIREDTSVEEYAKLERRRIKQIEARVEELVKRLEDQGSHVAAAGFNRAEKQARVPASKQPDRCLAPTRVEPVRSDWGNPFERDEPRLANSDGS